MVGWIILEQMQQNLNFWATPRASWSRSSSILFLQQLNQRFKQAARYDAVDDIKSIDLAGISLDCKDTQGRIGLGYRARPTAAAAAAGRQLGKEKMGGEANQMEQTPPTTTTSEDVECLLEVGVFGELVSLSLVLSAVDKKENVRTA
ncbi:hypothetical protein Dimus_011811 [Dionaea muscipula]